jgi:hypothetical protein
MYQLEFWSKDSASWAVWEKLKAPSRRAARKQIDAGLLAGKQWRLRKV